MPFADTAGQSVGPPGGPGSARTEPWVALWFGSYNRAMDPYLPLTAFPDLDPGPEVSAGETAELSAGVPAGLTVADATRIVAALTACHAESTPGFHESLRTELLHEGSQVRVIMVQMPAVSTPQFSWVLSRLPRQAQQVPPIYQPEVAARAVVYAADHPRRRENWVGETTMATLLANAVAPGLLDRYLAGTGDDAQQTDRRKSPDQPANLWEPADGDDGRDFGGHGLFDQKAYAHSPQVWASQHHRTLAFAGVALVAGAAALARSVRR